MQFIAADIEPGGQAVRRRIHLLAGEPGGLENVVGLDLGLAVIAVEPSNRLTRGVGSARVLEMGEACERRLAERGNCARTNSRSRFMNGPPLTAIG